MLQVICKSKKMYATHPSTPRHHHPPRCVGALCLGAFSSPLHHQPTPALPPSPPFSRPHRHFGYFSDDHSPRHPPPPRHHHPHGCRRPPGGGREGGGESGRVADVGRLLGEAWCGDRSSGLVPSPFLKKNNTDIFLKINLSLLNITQL